MIVTLKIVGMLAALSGVYWLGKGDPVPIACVAIVLVNVLFVPPPDP